MTNRTPPDRDVQGFANAWATRKRRPPRSSAWSRGQPVTATGIGANSRSADVNDGRELVVPTGEAGAGFVVR